MSCCDCEAPIDIPDSPVCLWCAINRILAGDTTRPGWTPTTDDQP